MESEGYLTVQSLLGKINELQILLNKTARYGDVRGVLHSIKSYAVRLVKLCPEHLHEMLKNEISASVDSFLSSFAKYKPEEILKEDDKYRILDRCYAWNSVASLVLELTSSQARIKNYAVELYEMLESSPSLSWTNIRSKILTLKGYLINSEKIFPDCNLLKNLIDKLEVYYIEIEKKLGQVEQRDRDRLKGLIKEWIGIIENIFLECESRRAKPELLIEPPPTPRAEPLGSLRISVKGEWYQIDLDKFSYLTLGRFDPGGHDPPVGGAPDGLKVKDERGNILKVFNGVECRWGCAQSDPDCTHREHVKIEVDRGSHIVKVRHAEQAWLPIYFGFSLSEMKELKKGEEVVLRPGSTLYLWISGVYADAKSKRERTPVELGIVSPARSTLIMYK